MVYLLHFARRLHHAGHYVGWTRDAGTLPARIEHHRNGSGARLLAAVADAGIDFAVVRTWPDGDRTLERRLKNGKRGPRLCPVCNPTARKAA